MTDSRTAQLPATEADDSTGDVSADGTPGGATDAVTSEILVEEVSIDGMCGVY
jgi:mycofactocin precursor